MRLSLRTVMVTAATMLVAAPAVSAPPGTVNVPSVLETVPTGVTGDTADDPAIWVNTGRTRWRPSSSPTRRRRDA